MRRRPTIVPLACVVLGTGAFAAWYLPRNLPDPNRSRPARLELRVGERCRVATPGESWVAGAATREIAERWDELSRARDAVGRAQLEQAGLVTRVPVGTGGRLIRLGEPACEVRIHAGELAGLALWIPRRFLAP